MAHPPNNCRTTVVPDPTITKPTTTTSTTIYNLTRSLSKSANIEPTSTHNNAKTTQRQVLETGYNNKSLVVEERKSQNTGSNPGRNNLWERQRRASITGLEKRESFCDVRVDLSDFLLAHCAKVVSVDMPSLLQIHAVGFARKVKDSLEKFSAKTLALSLKKEFDGAYGPAWHCIVGSSFGSFVTHSVGGFLYFSLDQKVYILLFKTTVQRVD